MKTKMPLLALGLVVLTFLAFYPVLSAGFTNWDDPVMVTQNPTITSLSWSHLVTYFTTLIEKHYHPLVLVSYAVDYQLFGLNPLGFHLTSLGLHLASTVLVFWLFSTLSRNLGIGFLTAALFGFHPMHVESVAWISERKDVLYAIFFWGALLSHTYYVRRNQRSLYWLTLSLFGLSLLSKSMAVTLPVALLLFDWFLGRKFDRSVILEKVPHFALSLAAAGVTFMGHYDPSVGPGSGSSPSWLRMIQAPFENLMFYAIKLVAPTHLAALYPVPRDLGNIPEWVFAWSPLILIAIGALAYRRVRASKTATFGLLFFLITLFPVSQILPIGLSIPADRYTYVPYVGLFFGLLSLLEPFMANRPQGNRRAVLGTALALVLAGSWWLTFQRVKVWRDSTTLWEDTVAKYPVPRAYLNLGLEYLTARDDLKSALALFSKAVAADPELAAGWLNRGVVYARQGDFTRSIADYNEAERLNSKLADIYLNRGTAYAAIDMPDRALSDLTTAVTLRPTAPEGWYNRGNLFLAIRQWNRAIADLTKSLTLQDGFPVRINRGNAYWSAGNLSKAFDDYTVAIKFQPGSPNAYYYRARIYARYGQHDAALTDARKAMSLGLKLSDQELAALRR